MPTFFRALFASTSPDYRPVAARPVRRPAAIMAMAALSLALASTAAAPPFPDVIVLPNDAVAGDVGFQPEGIAVDGTTAYVGSLADGTVVTVDLRSGEVNPLVQPDGDPALGVEAAGPLLLTAGVTSGELRAYDRQTGAEVAVYDVTDVGLVNDIAVAAGTAYFTDSQRAVLYALPLRARTTGRPREIPLTGDFRLAAPGAGVFNANGIVALDADTLVVAQTNDPDGEGSALYAVSVPSGVATRVAVEGGDVDGADGLVRRGRTLWVVQNYANSVAELRLSADGTTARYVRTITDQAFASPTTAGLSSSGDLYVVNARFGTAPSDDVTYEIVRIRR